MGFTSEGTCLLGLVGSFSSDEGDRNENAIWTYNFSFLYLFHDYWNLLNLENTGELYRN